MLIGDLPPQVARCIMGQPLRLGEVLTLRSVGDKNMLSEVDEANRQAASQSKIRAVAELPIHLRLLSRSSESVDRMCQCLKYCTRLMY